MRNWLLKNHLEDMPFFLKKQTNKRALILISRKSDSVYPEERSINVQFQIRSLTSGFGNLSFLLLNFTLIYLSNQIYLGLQI